MTMMQLTRGATFVGVAALFMAAPASAVPITYSTNTVGTGFNGGGALFLNSTSGEAATLTYVPNVSSTSGVPSFINYGDFTLACSTCTPVLTSTFAAFTFDLIIADTTDGATGKFLGTSAGGTVSSNTSTMSLVWAPAQLGPGTSNALTGSFGGTIFAKPALTAIVAPNSGTPPGLTSIEGYVDSAAVPEPATFALLGVALLGLGALRHKRSRR